MSKDIYPNARYIKRTRNRPEEQNDACRRMAGIHIHKGLANHNQALKVYNFCVEKFDRIIDFSEVRDTERYNIVPVAFTNWMPPSYTSWRNFFEVACQQGFAGELKNCHHLFRLTRHGTIEFRQFNTTDNFHKIFRWAEELNTVVREALNQ